MIEEIIIERHQYPSTPELDRLRDMHGQPTIQLIQTLHEIKVELGADRSQKPHVAWQLKKGLIGALATQDPNFAHFAIAREAMQAEISSDSPEYKDIINDLAIKINEHCGLLNAHIATQGPLKEFFEILFQGATDEVGSVASLAIADLTDAQVDHLFEKDTLFLIDHIYLEHLKHIGRSGAKTAKNIKPTLEGNLTFFKETGKIPMGFWFNTQSSNKKPIFTSPALQILAKEIFNDVIKPLLLFKNNNVPAITTKVQVSLTKLLSPKNKIKQADQKLNLFHQESLLGSIQIPAISQSIFDSVFKGVQKLNTVTGHRLIRYFPQSAFEQKVNGHADYRILKFDRGATEIAEYLGLNRGGSISDIKDIIQAMAYLEFNGPILTGNLIQLSKYVSPVTHRQDEAYLITVGPPLLPYQTFQDGGLLIPLLKDPPLVGPNRYHAHQYFLQMQIMSEFTKQSIFLAQHEVVQITQQQWEEVAQQCDLPKEILVKIQDRWTNDGPNEAKFLVRVEENFYTLGPNYKKELNFLKEQGRLRIKQSNRGTASAIKRTIAKSK